MGQEASYTIVQYSSYMQAVAVNVVCSCSGMAMPTAQRMLVKVEYVQQKIV
jgi:hypothetical protein